jgi:hypothetical protein
MKVVKAFEAEVLILAASQQVPHPDLGKAKKSAHSKGVSMKYVSRRVVTVLAIAVLLLVPAASEAQLGGGIVYDPTNYQNALLRYYQLQQHLIELQKNVAKVTSHLNLALQMAQYIHNMPARYRAVFS